MGLSSNILWHQTKKSSLQKIIKSKCLLFSYSLEKVVFLDKDNTVCTNENAIPMVCVSDLPFTEVTKTLKSYGGYAIGLKKSWGIRNGFTSVWYCDQTSFVLNNVMQVLGPEASETQDALIHVLCYVKNYEGQLLRSNNDYSYERFRFYDEREFRVVPSFDAVDMDGTKFPLNASQYESYKQRHDTCIFNTNENSGLQIGIEDISYLLVKDDDERSEFAGLLQSSFNTDFAKMNIQIFSYQQLREDFIGTDHNKKMKRS